MKKILYFIMIFAAAFATMFALAACGKKDDETGPTEIAAEIPYVSDFACDYYVGGRFSEYVDRSTAFQSEEEILIKLSFTLSPEAYENGKRKLTVKPVLPECFVGSFVSANTSSVSGDDFAATYDVDDRKSKNCEIEFKAKFNFSGGELKIEYAYDDDEYQTTGSYFLLCGQSLKFTYDAETDGYIVSKDQDNSEWISAVTRLKIPETFAGKPVTVLGDSLFSGCNLITSVLIPDTVINIGSGAFFNCGKLSSITIPYGVTNIGRSAFYGCSSLTSITIPNKVTDIGDYAFHDCSSLTSITILNGVTSIGNGAFYGCSSLTSITIPNGVTSIGNGAFYGCSSLTSIIIPNNVTDIGYSAFYGCSSLTSIIIPNNVTDIGYSAFYDCSSLTSITIPNSVTSIGNGAFYGCNSLEYNRYENALYLGNENNPYLVLVKAASADVTNVDINEFTKIIYEQAFAKCVNLTSITIPDSVTSIGKDAFSGCNALKYNEYNNAYYLGNEKNPYAVLIKPVDTYVREVKIHEDTKCIGAYAFFYCESLKNITIGRSVTSIGEYAFCRCSSLTSIVIPDCVTTIGGALFWGCSNLTSVKLSAGITSITGSMFRECEKLTSVTIPENITSIEDAAFDECEGLVSITIKGRLTSVGGSFYRCKSLTSIIFNGTKEEWLSIISPATGSVYDKGLAVIYCSDGNFRFDVGGVPCIDDV